MGASRRRPSSFGDDSSCFDDHNYFFKERIGYVFHRKVRQACEEEGVVVEGAGVEDFTMVVWNMEMVWIVQVAMVVEDAVVEGVVVSWDEGEDEAMVPNRSGIMTMVNMMHHQPHVAAAEDVESESEWEGEEAEAEGAILELIEQTEEQLIDRVGVDCHVYFKVKRWLHVCIVLCEICLCLALLETCCSHVHEVLFLLFIFFYFVARSVFLLSWAGLVRFSLYLKISKSQNCMIF